MQVRAPYHSLRRRPIICTTIQALPCCTPAQGRGCSAGIAEASATRHPYALLHAALPPGRLPQAPEGRLAQEALSALQAEVRCYSREPAAAEAVAAAAVVTPDNADRLLVQLTSLLASMEARQQRDVDRKSVV